MKRRIILACVLTLSGACFGQQTADVILEARALSASGRTDQAVKVLDDAIARSANGRLYLERAEIKLGQKEYSGAIADLNEANRLIPSSGEYGLARTYALKGDASTSLYHLELSMNSPFRKSEKEILLDQSFRMVDNKPEWRQFWKKEWYSAEEKALSEIEFYISAGKASEAREVLNDLKNTNDNDDAVTYATALMDLSSGKYSDAVRGITGLLSANPENEKYLRVLARAQSLSGNAAGASGTYTRLFEAGVADAGMLLSRAECYIKTGETDKALKDVEKYLGLYPENREAISMAGKLEAATGDNLKAIDYFSRNLKLHPDDPQCYTDRANSYFVSRSWDWAIKDYSMSLDLSPANSDAWLNKGISLLNTGRVEDACHDFRKALGLGNKRATEYISSNCIK